MKRSQQCIFKLSSSTPKTTRVKYVTWHAILTSTTHLHFTAHAGPSFLNFKPVEATPQNTPATQAHGVTLNTHEQCCAQSQDRHSPHVQTHAALASAVAALHVNLICLSAQQMQIQINFRGDAPVTISQLLVQSVKQEESVTGTEDQ